MNLLTLENLQVSIGPVQAVRDVSLSLARGECRALVGESGCGKSVTAMSLLNLMPSAAETNAGRWEFGVTLLHEDGLESGSYAIPDPYSSINQRSLCNKCHVKDAGDHITVTP